jgi:hypothetical protein
VHFPPLHFGGGGGGHDGHGRGGPLVWQLCALHALLIAWSFGTCDFRIGAPQEQYVYPVVQSPSALQPLVLNASLIPLSRAAQDLGTGPVYGFSVVSGGGGGGGDSLVESIGGGSDRATVPVPGSAADADADAGADADADAEADAGGDAGLGPEHIVRRKGAIATNSRIARAQ